MLLVTVSPAREIWVKKARLFRQRLGGFSYAFRTMRMKSVTKSNAIKSLIVISNAPFRGLRIDRHRCSSTAYIIAYIQSLWEVKPFKESAYSFDIEIGGVFYEYDR